MDLRALLVTVAISSASCGRLHDGPASLPSSPSMEAKLELYKSMVADVRDADGFIETDQCDSTTFSALLGAVTRPINVRAAMEENHRLHRRPLSYAECYPKDSKSTISNDAFLYLLAYGVAHEDLELLKDVFAYGKARAWRMGDGDPFRTIMRPGLISMYARAIKALGGPDHLERLVPPVEFDVKTGFEAHLQVVSVLVKGKIDGLEDSDREVLRRQVERQPDNALFRAAAARWVDVSHAARAEELLENEAWWPADHLPTSANTCDHWPLQRDMPSPDWEPCPDEKHQHSGGDFVYAASVLLGRF